MTVSQSEAGRGAGVIPPRGAKGEDGMKLSGSSSLLDGFDGDVDVAADQSQDLLGVVNQLQKQQLKRTLPQQIAEKLSQRILLGLIPPRSRLIEQQIVDEFEVSNGPAREALRLLAAEGLVVIQSHRGALVAELSRDDIREIYDIRMVLWGLAARRACEKDDLGLADMVQTAADEMKSERIINGSAAAYLKVAFGALVRLALATGNWRLCALLRQSVLPVLRYSQLKVMTIQQRRASAEMWLSLADAMRRQDADAAESIARKIISMTADAILAVAE